MKKRRATHTHCIINKKLYLYFHEIALNINTCTVDARGVGVEKTIITIIMPIYSNMAYYEMNYEHIKRAIKGQHLYLWLFLFKAFPLPGRLLFFITTEPPTFIW